MDTARLRPHTLRVASCKQFGLRNSALDSKELILEIDVKDPDDDLPTLQLVSWRQRRIATLMLVAEIRSSNANQRLFEIVLPGKGSDGIGLVREIIMR